MTIGDLHELVHTAKPAVQVHWHDRLRPGRDRVLDMVHAHVVIVSHVNENYARADVVDGRHGCDEGMGDRNDLIARPNTSRFEDQAKTIRAVADTDGIPGPNKRSQTLLEVNHLLAHY